MCVCVCFFLNLNFSVFMITMFNVFRIDNLPRWKLVNKILKIQYQAGKLLLIFKKSITGWEVINNWVDNQVFSQ